LAGDFVNRPGGVILSGVRQHGVEESAFFLEERILRRPFDYAPLRSGLLRMTEEKRWGSRTKRPLGEGAVGVIGGIA